MYALNDWEDSRRFEITKFLLDKGYDINSFSAMPFDNGRSYTALHLTILDNDIDGASFLLKEGADPNIKARPNGETALEYAQHLYSIRGSKMYDPDTAKKIIQMLSDLEK